MAGLQETLSQKRNKTGTHLPGLSQRSQKLASIPLLIPCLDCVFFPCSPKRSPHHRSQVPLSNLRRAKGSSKADKLGKETKTSEKAGCRKPPRSPVHHVNPSTAKETRSMSRPAARAAHTPPLMWLRSLRVTLCQQLQGQRSSAAFPS